jgi:tetratricopeptide (TPR) repeat protein
LGCLCAVAGLLQAQSATTSTGAKNTLIEREFQAAMAAEDKGDLDRAESLLVDLRAHHPGIFAVDESLGLLYAGRNKIAEALPVLDAAAREEPFSDVAHVNLGAAYFKLHRNQEALEEYERAAQLNPKNAKVQQGLGQLWLEAHKPERAAEAFAAALQQDPGNPDLLLNRATALEEAGLTGQASEILANLPGADQSAAAQSLLGDIDEKSGAFQKAVQDYIRAADLDPSETNTWVVGIEFLRHWTFDAAIREFEAGTAKFPQSARMRLGLGVAYYGNATYAKAISVFADLLDGDTGNGLYAELLGLSCTAVMQETKGRCSALLSYAKSHPGDAKVSVDAASTLVEGAATDEQVSLARKLLQSAIAANPKLAEAQYEMGVLMQNQGDWMGSISNLKAAVELKPSFSQAHYRLALAYWRSGGKQEGQAEMELAKKYRKQQQDDLDQRLRQITTFLVDAHN